MTEKEHVAQVATVVLDVDHSGGVFELVLVNIGASVAYDVQVGFSQPLIGVGGRIDVGDLNVWKRLKTLRPGKEIRVLLDTSANVFRRGKRNAFIANVSWRDDAGKRSAEYRHDLEAYRGIPTVIADS